MNVSPAAGLNVSGIKRPQLCRADQVDLADDVRVVGVQIDGEARAYVLEAFEVNRVTAPDDLAAHVVSDVVGGEPICVTHCNKTHSTRILKPGDRSQVNESKRLELGVGGWHNGLLLVYDGVRYHHHSPKIPLRDVPFVTTTWQQWRSAHSDTLVYTGKACQEPEDSG